MTVQDSDLVGKPCKFGCSCPPGGMCGPRRLDVTPPCFCEPTLNDANEIVRCGQPFCCSCAGYCVAHAGKVVRIQADPSHPQHELALTVGPPPTRAAGS